MRHNYEQEFGDIWSLPAQNNFYQFFLITNDAVFFLTGENVSSLNVFQVLGLGPVNGRF